MAAILAKPWRVVHTSCSLRLLVLGLLGLLGLLVELVLLVVVLVVLVVLALGVAREPRYKYRAGPDPDSGPGAACP